MEIKEIEFYEKNESKYYCEFCDYKCSYISDWSRHQSTRKHLVSKDGNKMEINGNKLGEKNENNYYHSCDNCKKIYKTLSMLIFFTTRTYKFIFYWILADFWLNFGWILSPNVISCNLLMFSTYNMRIIITLFRCSLVTTFTIIF